MQSASSAWFTWLSLHYARNNGMNSYYCIRVAVISPAHLKRKTLSKHGGGQSIYFDVPFV